MKGSIIPREAPMRAAAQLGVLNRLARKVLLARLRGLRRGMLTVVEGAERKTFGTLTPGCSIRATLSVHDPRTYSFATFGGSVGAAEAYIQGWWSADDLTSLCRLFAINQGEMMNLEKGLARLSTPLFRLLHFLNRNHRAGSRRNIAAHYDLGNDFFRLFLDETMMYSCAVFEGKDMMLEEASRAKINRICRKLQLSPQDHLLEIGTGWGGFAVHAAAQSGCRVTTTTISEQQYELATHRVKDAGLADRVTVLKKDYRDLKGRYDKLVSIEMIEAVGHQYLDSFFKKCSDLLKPDGMMLLQAITIADQQYERARRGVDFIKKYIFPGCFSPSVTAMINSVTRSTDLRLFHLEDIGPHYATTLRRWRERFFENLDRVRTLGYLEPFIRMWEYYFCYCEAGFLERHVSDVQMLLTKPGCRREPLLPQLL